jgi:hypothetical protein
LRFIVLKETFLVINFISFLPGSVTNSSKHGHIFYLGIVRD